MKKVVAALIAALVALVPAGAFAQSRSFHFDVSALETDTDGKKIGYTASGTFAGELDANSAGLSYDLLETGAAGTFTFFNDYNTVGFRSTYAIIGLDNMFPGPGRITFNSAGMVVGGRFTLFGTAGDQDLGGVIFDIDNSNASIGEGGYAISDITVTPLADATAVPEPATWALMIVGFGVAGAALRRRRTRVAIA